MKNGGRTFERVCATAMAGVFVPFSLSVLVFIVCGFKRSLDVWQPTVDLAAVALIPGAAAGVIGGAVGRSGRASAYGVFLFFSVASEYLWLDGWKTWATIANLAVLAPSVGALAGGAGAIIGRAISNGRDDQRGPGMSFSEWVIAGFLGAVLLIYICWIV